MNKLQFIFVHGLSGWGSYDAVYKRMPYWGMRGGDLIAYLRAQGFDCAAASVAPTGSAWDRACELYAQLSGTRTDYGAAHSRRFGHDRFGKDFSGRPLIPAWDGRTRLVLLGHSFGGATVRLFAELMANGDAAECAESRSAEDLSPFFHGGLGGRIRSVVTLASPMNGTTAYDLFEDPSFDASSVKVPLHSRLLARMMSRGTAPKQDGRSPEDYADHDMHVDNALAMNARIETRPDVYYFSIPCSFTEKQPDGRWKARRGIEPLFVMRANQIGAYSGRTRGGAELGPAWRENDGLVNTVSASAPQGAPRKALDRADIRPGLWNVFPVYAGDHMALQGGLLHKHDIRGFYLDLLNMISGLPDPAGLRSETD